MINNSFLKSFRETKSPFITNPYRFAAATAAGGWKELSRTTLDPAGDNITVSSLADKRYYMILLDAHAGSGAVQAQLQAGNGSIDTGTNYAHRFSNNGGADGSGAGDTDIHIGSTSDNGQEFNIIYGANYSGKEKLFQSWQANNHTGTGATNAPSRVESVGKWDYTLNPLDTINIFNRNSGSYGIGDQLVVLGWDPADDDTGGFWSELASVDIPTGTNANLNSGSFTAKKYLWVQAYMTNATNSLDSWLSFNGDNTSGNYARRKSDNGAADTTSLSQNKLNIGASDSTTIFANYFIINNSANEKLVIGQTVGQAAAGVGNTPVRKEWACKWVNTSAQITSVNHESTGTAYGAGSIIKVWGSD
jgi:hypothetical protein